MDEAELLKTFNSGLGMIAVVPADKAEAAAKMLRDAGETVFTIGTVTDTDGVAYTGSLL